MKELAPAWQLATSAPDGPLLLAYITGDRLEWIESGRRGKGACRFLFYSLHGRSISPTHWMPLPPLWRDQQESLIQLVKLGEAVVDDLLKSTGGGIVCQDYGRLNSFLVAAQALGQDNDKDVEE